MICDRERWGGGETEFNYAIEKLLKHSRCILLFCANSKSCGMGMQCDGRSSNWKQFVIVDFLLRKLNFRSHT